MGMGGSSYSGGYRYEARKPTTQPTATVQKTPISPTTRVLDFAPRTAAQDSASASRGSETAGVRAREWDESSEDEDLKKEKEGKAKAATDEAGTRVGAASGDGWDTWAKSGNQSGNRAARDEIANGEGEIKGRDIEEKGLLKNAVDGVVRFWKKKTFNTGQYGRPG